MNDRTEDEKIIQRITDACKQFYKIFDRYPEKVGVHFRRHGLTYLYWYQKTGQVHEIK